LQGDSNFDVCAEHGFLAALSMSKDESDVDIFFSDVTSDSSDTPELTEASSHFAIEREECDL
jgi:hypothetical protein